MKLKLTEDETNALINFFLDYHRWGYGKTEIEDVAKKYNMTEESLYAAFSDLLETHRYSSIEYE